MLKVHEIFASIQGESSFAGWPCGFLRLSGCNLACRWCDTLHAGDSHAAMGVAEAVAALVDLGLPLVEITGGEPLLAPQTPELVTALCDLDLTVLVETNGSLDITVLDPRATAIVDVKCPGSGMEDHNDYGNLERLRPNDEVKFVLTDRADYDFALEIASQVWRTHIVHFSPVAAALSPAQLAAWMVADKVQARLGLQLHKYIWSPDARGV